MSNSCPPAIRTKGQKTAERERERERRVLMEVWPYATGMVKAFPASDQIGIWVIKRDSKKNAKEEKDGFYRK